MSENKKIKNKNTDTAYRGADKLLKHIQLDFGRDLKLLVINFFETLDELIFQIADNSKSKVKKELYFDSLKSIRVHKLNVLSSFFKTLKQTFDLFEKKNFEYFEDRVTKFDNEQNKTSSTFDKNDITEKLAQNSVIHKYERNYINQLTAFNKRFSVLIGTNVGLYHIPVGPYVIVSAFAKSVRLLHLDINLKLILYKHFEHSVMSQLDDIYKSINLYLNQNGIVTGIENNIINQAVNISKTRHNKDKQEKIVAYEAEFLLQELDVLKKKISDDLIQSEDMRLSPVEVEQALLVQIMQTGKNNNCYIDQSDKDTLNLTSLLFQLINEDKNIPKTIANIITEIQIPYLKAALLDKELIRKKQHPAQSLLNLITKSSVGWNSELDSNDAFVNNLKKTMQAIVSSPKLDEMFFKEQFCTYQTFISQMKNSFASEQKRIKEKSKGKEKIVAAMNTVEALLSLKMDNSSIPKIPKEIKIILLGPWKSLLMLLLVRHSNSSEKYLLMVNFIDDLLNLLESNQYDVVIRNNIAKLAKEYEYGLKLVAYNGDELNKKVNDFKQCLSTHHNLDKDNTEANVIPEANSKDSIITRIHTRITDYVVDQPDKSTATTNNSNLNLLKGLNSEDKALLTMITTGTWIDFTHKNGKLIRTQLSWISPSSKKYIFVNERGLKITDKSAQELADDLRNERAILI